jgi:hypothetical protein
MAILLPGDEVVCRECGARPVGDTLGLFWGEDRWEKWDPTCRHESFFICNMCRDKDLGMACRECGCGEFYC